MVRENYSPEPPLVYFPIHRSTDGGTTWSSISTIVDTVNNWGLRYQPFLYLLPQKIGNLAAGTILAAGLSIPTDLSKTKIDIVSIIEFFFLLPPGTFEKAYARLRIIIGYPFRLSKGISAVLFTGNRKANSDFPRSMLLQMAASIGTSYPLSSPEDKPPLPMEKHQSGNHSSWSSVTNLLSTTHHKWTRHMVKNSVTKFPQTA